MAAPPPTRGPRGPRSPTAASQDTLETLMFPCSLWTDVCYCQSVLDFQAEQLRTKDLNWLPTFLKHFIFGLKRE